MHEKSSDSFTPNFDGSDNLKLHTSFSFKYLIRLYVSLNQIMHFTLYVVMVSSKMYCGYGVSSPVIQNQKKMP